MNFAFIKLPLLLLHFSLYMHCCVSFKFYFIRVTGKLLYQDVLFIHIGVYFTLCHNFTNFLILFIYITSLKITQMSVLFIIVLFKLLTACKVMNLFNT